MDIIKDKTKDKIYIPNSLTDDFSNKNICFLDIETTGLSGRYNKVILIGLYCIDKNESYITQFFANFPTEEYDLLISFIQFIDEFEYIITYNGTSFDIPFLKKRLEFYNIDFDFGKFTHMDLLKLVRKNKEILKLSNCKLTTVEQSLGIFRADTITGKESVKLYNDYVYSKDPTKRTLILKHNYDDIYYLPRLLTIYDIIDSVGSLKTVVKFSNQSIRLSITKGNLEFSKNVLTIIGQSEKILVPQQIYYKDFYSLKWKTDLGELSIEINYKSAQLSSGEKCDYINLSDTGITLDQLIKADYNVPDDILLLKVEDQIVYENILSLTQNIISNLD